MDYDKFKSMESQELSYPSTLVHYQTQQMASMPPNIAGSRRAQIITVNMVMQSFELDSFDNLLADSYSFSALHYP